jgi:hypothetical protein
MCAAMREPNNAGSSHRSLEQRRSEQNNPGTKSPEDYLPLHAQRTSRQPNRAPHEFSAEPPWLQPGQPGAFRDNTTDSVAAAEHGAIGPWTESVANAHIRTAPTRAFGVKSWLIGAALIVGGVGGFLAAYGPRIVVPTTSAAVKEPEPVIPAMTQAVLRTTKTARTAHPQLTLGVVRVWKVNEPASLSISYPDIGLSDSVVIEGLSPGSTLPVGIPAGPNGWRLASTDLKRAVIKPPLGFLGVMNLTLQLRLADDAIADSKNLQLEWAGGSAAAPSTPAVPSPRRLDASEIALLIKRGEELVASGNIGAARMMFEPAAEAGDPKAALALAETYDPAALEKLGARGITPDIALAQQWYEKAKALGSTEAPRRSVALGH